MCIKGARSVGPYGGTAGTRVPYSLAVSLRYARALEASSDVVSLSSSFLQGQTCRAEII